MNCNNVQCQHQRNLKVALVGELNVAQVTKISKTGLATLVVQAEPKHCQMNCVTQW